VYHFVIIGLIIVLK